jgi:hypothetical protein
MKRYQFTVFKLFLKKEEGARESDTHYVQLLPY